MEQADFLYQTACCPEIYQELFPLHLLCGHWTNGLFSPDLYVFKKGKGYRLKIIYPSGASYTTRIFRTFNTTFTNLCELVRIGYDEENDRLFLSTEGSYRRSNEEDIPSSYY